MRDLAHFKNKTKRQSGFGLILLLISVTVLAILISFGFKSYYGGTAFQAGNENQQNAPVSTNSSNERKNVIESAKSAKNILEERDKNILNDSL